MKSFGLILGSSGTGKGTRMNQFMQFLNTKYTPEIFEAPDKNGKPFPLGLIYNELDLLIIGKYVNNKQTGISSWASMDTTWSKFGGTEPTVAYIKTLPFNILAEGYANMDTFRVRPIHMSSEGCDKFFYQVYSYGKENFDEYIKRIVGRSGKPPKGTTAFEKEGAVVKWEDKILDEIGEKGFDGDVYGKSFDSDINSIGKDYLNFLELHYLREEFIEYSKNNKFFKEFKPNEIEEW